MPPAKARPCRKALDYVLQPDSQTPEGYFGAKDGSRMYGHGITTLMLAEMLGMGADANQDELIRTRCRHAVELILRAQKVTKNELNQGGWRYTPDAGDSDMSVTVWQTMALRAAKNAGLDVPKERDRRRRRLHPPLLRAAAGAAGEPGRRLRLPIARARAFHHRRGPARAPGLRPVRDPRGERPPATACSRTA